MRIVIISLIVSLVVTLITNWYWDRYVAPRMRRRRE